MPAKERSNLLDERPAGGDQSYRQRQHREAMAINKPPQALNQRADDQPSQWDDTHWDHDHDEAGHRARLLLSQSNLGLHEVGDSIGALRLWFARNRWVKRIAVVVGVLLVIFTACFGALWWRLGAGPINLELATPWLAAAIEDNIGHGNTVEVGGTQIERAGRIRIAVRIRDIVVRDRDHAVVASAPKAEVRLSGTALLTGRLRAESLNLVDAELSVRITPDGQVTVSTGDNARPSATGVATWRAAVSETSTPTMSAAGLSFAGSGEGVWSLPAWAQTWSLPLPASTKSLPAPVTTTSSPSPANTRAAPPSTQARSLPRPSDTVAGLHQRLEGVFALLTGEFVQGHRPIPPIDVSRPLLALVNLAGAD